MPKQAQCDLLFQHFCSYSSSYQTTASVPKSIPAPYRPWYPNPWKSYHQNADRPRHCSSQVVWIANYCERFRSISVLTYIFNILTYQISIIPCPYDPTAARFTFPSPHDVPDVPMWSNHSTHKGTAPSYIINNRVHHNCISLVTIPLFTWNISTNTRCTIHPGIIPFYPITVRSTKQILH